MLFGCQQGGSAGSRVAPLVALVKVLLTNAGAPVQSWPMRNLLVIIALALLFGCGPPATPTGQDILVGNVEADLKPEDRKALVGAVHMPVAGITFPDGQGSVDVEVIVARGATRDGDKMTVDLQREPTFMRSILVKVKDAAGYQISAQLVGNPVNVGTAESPIHARIVQITRQKSGLFGSSMAQMSLRASPRGVERL